MAIKIDLLPVTVALRRRLQRVILLSVLLLALAASALVLVLDAKQKELKVANANLAVIKTYEAENTAAEGQLATFISDAKAINDTVGFMLVAGKTGPQRAALLNQVRQYIYNDTVVTGIDLSDGKTARISGSVKSPDQYAAFLFNLRNASAVEPYGGPLFSDLPRAGGVGGFNNGAARAFVLPNEPVDQPVIIPYPLDIAAVGTLKYPVQLPPDPVGAKGTAPNSPTVGGASGSGSSSSSSGSRGDERR